MPSGKKCGMACRWATRLPPPISRLVRLSRQRQRSAVAGQGAFHRGSDNCGAIWKRRNLAEKQAQWLVGRNPFAASVMYGEGYDWTPLYSVRSGQMVGALPVGIETKGFDDAPYWPTQICWTYKEVWSQPVGQWIWLMQDVAVPATVQRHGGPGEPRTGGVPRTEEWAGDDRDIEPD